MDQGTRVSLGAWFFVVLVLTAKIGFAVSKFETVAFHRDGRVETLPSVVDAGVSVSREISIGSAGGLPSFFDKVIGVDERDQITNTKAFPFRAIGRIALGCTGTLISPKHVLTAGHCVYDTDSGTWNQDLNFSPGLNGSNDPYGTAEWETAYAVKGWTEDHSDDFDYGVIVLKESIGSRVGYMSYAYDNNLNQTDVRIVGYPGDKPEGTMWSSQCPLTNVGDKRMTYECDTYGGNSGSAIFVEHETGGRTIYGVHTMGTAIENSGTRITQTVYQSIRGWVTQE